MKLEYKIVTDKYYITEDELNKLGNEGWELTTYNKWENDSGQWYTCILKRIKTEE